MRTLGRVLVRALVPVLVAAGFLVPGLQPAATATTSAGTPGYCTDATGVTVVVDFQELGGGVVIRCFPHPTSSSTGLAALQGAGFTPTGTVRFGLGFICRIEGVPTAADEKCIDTPPATAYWSYWYAPNGGSWKYSDLGVTNHKVILGGFEGWSFAKDKTSATVPSPRVAPHHAVTVPTPTPTQKPMTAPAATPTTQPASHSTAVPAPGASNTSAPSPAAGGATAPAAGTTTPGSTPSGGAGVAAGTASGPPISYSVARRESGNGSATGAIAGLALVVAALGAAGAVALRRRRDRAAEGG